MAWSVRIFSEQNISGNIFLVNIFYTNETKYVISLLNSRNCLFFDCCNYYLDIFYTVIIVKSVK